MAAPILIAGAGIAGLATAAALQRKGFAVAVVEARTDTSAGVGISLWPNALAALDEIGLGEAVRSAGGRVTAGAVRWHDGTWLRRPEPERLIRALTEPLVVIRRPELTEILTGALPAGTVEYGTALRGLTVTGDGVRVTLSDGSIREVSAVVGADGVDSVVARHLNGPLRRRYAGYTAWRGVARYRLDPDLAGETLAPGLLVGHVPLGADHTYWFACDRAPEGATSPDGELAELRRRFASWVEPVPALLAAAEPTVLRNDIFDRATARCWARGPVVLVGDAAHPMRPHLGQGGCQGVEDAAILAGLAAHSPDLPTAFTGFSALRRRRVQMMVRESRLIGRLMNMRPRALGGAASRLTVLIPESALARHMTAVAAYSAFRPAR